MLATLRQRRTGVVSKPSHLRIVRSVTPTRRAITERADRCDSFDNHSASFDVSGNPRHRPADACETAPHARHRNRVL